MSQAEQSNMTRLNLVSPFLYIGSGAGTSSSGLFSDFALQGIKGSNANGEYLITGTSGKLGIIYNGPINHAMSRRGSGSGSWTVMNVPKSFNASSTSIYGVANLGGNSSAPNVNLVGSYISNQVDSSGSNPRIGFYYTGPITSNPQPKAFKSYQAEDPITKRKATFTYIHSVDGGLAVGNYDFLGDGNPAGKPFIYDPVTGTQTGINYGSGGATNTAYGIWHNNGSSYTIAGGEGLNGGRLGDNLYGEPLGKGTLIDYNKQTGTFSNYTSFSFSNRSLLPKTMRDQVQNQALVTHFEGIWSDGKGTYKLPATLSTTDGKLGVAAVATVKRTSSGKFGPADWAVLDIPGSVLTTNDSIYGDACLGAGIYANTPGASTWAGLVV